MVHLNNMAGVANDSRSNLLTIGTILLCIWGLSVTLTSTMKREVMLNTFYSKRTHSILREHILW